MNQTDSQRSIISLKMLHNPINHQLLNPFKILTHLNESQYKETSHHNKIRVTFKLKVFRFLKEDLKTISNKIINKVGLCQLQLKVKQNQDLILLMKALNFLKIQKNRRKRKKKHQIFMKFQEYQKNIVQILKEVARQEESIPLLN